MSYICGMIIDEVKIKYHFCCVQSSLLDTAAETSGRMETTWNHLMVFGQKMSYRYTNQLRIRA
jgi:hypothetical protein